MPPARAQDAAEALAVIDRLPPGPVSISFNIDGCRSSVSGGVGQLVPLPGGRIAGVDPEPAGRGAAADERGRDRRRRGRGSADGVASPEAAGRGGLRAGRAASQHAAVPGERALPGGVPLGGGRGDGTAPPLRPSARRLPGALADRCTRGRIDDRTRKDQGMTEASDETLVASLRVHYGAAARKAAQAATAAPQCCEDATVVQDCCGSRVEACDTRFGSGLYEPGELEGLPVEAVAGSIGCANPVALADLKPGDDVLDLGSGGGIDVLLSARRGGPEGRAYGVG